MARDKYSTRKLLNSWANKYGARSDYHLAQLLGLTRQAVSLYRTGRRTLSTKLAAEMAKDLDMDVGLVLGDLALERINRPPPPAKKNGDARRQMTQRTLL